jgi:anaphase-promoting complex subunit 8
MGRKALFLSRISRREEAIESALLSIAGYPWNWSTWSLLGSLIGDGEEVCIESPCFIEPNVEYLLQLTSLIPLIPLLPSHPLVLLFQVNALNELHSPTENELACCDRLLGEHFFPDSLWVMSLRACVLYHLHGRSFPFEPSTASVLTIVIIM